MVEDRKRAVREYNRNVQSAVTKYNQAVRAHNVQVKRDAAQRKRQIEQLLRAASPRYVEVTRSTAELTQRFEAIDSASGLSSGIASLLELSEREADNSVSVAQALESDEPVAPDEMPDTGILEYLAGFSQDLCDRWKGAMFALNPANTDAARHFCTSVREIFTEILERWASNADVLEDDPDCDRTPNGTPSRRAKIRYLLRQKGADSPEMLGFVEQDIDDVLGLFKVFNEATHGAAGKHSFTKLQLIRQRVEGGIMFLAAVAL
ncbi:hypothetical protein ATO13_23601 [Stappia sp. 22II-S9-Z10]|nr:hypothetical protein ATO13_23601 [Stappia sp. 22II-S9-Z10]